MSHPAGSSGPRTHDARLARAAVVPLLVVTVLAVAVGAWLRGPAGAWGAFFAATIVGLFFGSGLLVSARTARVAPAQGMALAVAAHGVKVLLCGGLLIGVGGATWFDRDVLAVTLVCAALAWLGGQVRGFARLQLFAVEPASRQAFTRGSEGP